MWFFLPRGCPNRWACEKREFTDIDLTYRHVVVAVGKRSGCSSRASYLPFLGGPLLSPNLDVVCEQWALLAEQSLAISLLLSTRGSNFTVGHLCLVTKHCWEVTETPSHVACRHDRGELGCSAGGSTNEIAVWTWLEGKAFQESLWTWIGRRKWTTRTERQKKYQQIRLSILTGHGEAAEGNLGFLSIVLSW